MTKRERQQLERLYAIVQTSYKNAKALRAKEPENKEYWTGVAVAYGCILSELWQEYDFEI